MTTYNKDYLLRLLAILAYLFSAYLSYRSLLMSEEPFGLSLVWAFGSIIYWFITNYFEDRDRQWQLEDEGE